MLNTAIIWAVGIIAFVVLEAVTYQLVSIWFALGAAGGMIASALGARFSVQMTVFIAVTAVSLLCLRPVSVKLLKNKKERTNVDSLIGKDVFITRDIDNIKGVGEGRIGGMTWTARSADNTPIKANVTAVIEKVEGVKLIVKEKGE